MTTPDSAVRNYLTYLRDPEALRDEEQIATLQRLVEDAADPLDELQAQSELIKAQNVDSTSFRDSFIDHAKAYAEEHDIAPEAFRALGVPESDLRAAGLLKGSTKRGGVRSSASGRSRVSIEDVKAAAPASGSFTTKDLEDKTGASYGTIRKAIAELVQDKVITDEGTDPEWGGRGRAPVVYRKK